MISMSKKGPGARWDLFCVTGSRRFALSANSRGDATDVPGFKTRIVHSW
jgi:hypothetical protein